MGKAVYEWEDFDGGVTVFDKDMESAEISYSMYGWWFVRDWTRGGKQVFGSYYDAWEWLDSNGYDVSPLPEPELESDWDDWDD